MGDGERTTFLDSRNIEKNYRKFSKIQFFLIYFDIVLILYRSVLAELACKFEEFGQVLHTVETDPFSSLIDTHSFNQYIRFHEQIFGNRTSGVTGLNWR